MSNTRGLRFGPIWKRRTWLVLLLFIAGTAIGQAPRLNAERTVLETEPRQSVTLTFQITNESTAAWQGRPDLVLPAAWRTLVSPEVLSLDSGETRMIILPILIPQSAAAGTYPVLIGYLGDGEAGEDVKPLRFTIEVLPAHQLEVQLLAAPSLVVAEPYSLRFRVRNTGNTAEAVELSVRGNQGFRMTLAPATLALAPGAGQEVTVLVDAPSDLSKPVRHHVTLLAQATTRASASATTEVLAAGQDASQALHTFDLKVGVTGRFDSRQIPAGALDALGELEVELRGRGPMWDGDPGELDVSLRNSADLSQRRNLITYQHPDFSMSAGDQNMPLGRLLNPVKGLGVNLAIAPRDLSVGGWTYGTYHEDNLGFGIGLNGQPVPELFIEGRAQYRGGEAIVGAKAELSASLPDGARMTLGAEPAFNLMSSAPAVLVTAGGKGDGYSTSGYFRYQAEDYAAVSDPRTDVGIGGRARLSTQPRVWISGSYSRLKANPAREHQAVIAGLDGTLESVAWSAQYSDVRKVESDAHSHEFGVRLAATVPLAEDTTLRSIAAWTEKRNVLASGRNNRIVDADVAVFFPLLDGRGKAGGELEYDLLHPENLQLDAYVGWSGGVTSFTSLDTQARVVLGEQGRAELEVGARHTLDDGSTLTTTLTGSLPWEAVPRANAKFSMTLPVSVVIGRKQDVAEVRGRITDGSGRGVAGIVVWLAGFTAVTKEEGDFVFPAAPLGTHALTLRGLDAGLVTLPALPLKLQVIAEGNDPVELQLLRSAVLRGSVRLPAPESVEHSNGSGVIVGSREPMDRLLRSIALQVSGPGTTQRVALAADGTFRLTRLPPGEWQVRAVPESLPEYYRFDSMSQTATVPEGGEVEVTFDLVPLTRTIRFTGGGELGN